MGFQELIELKLKKISGQVITLEIPPSSGLGEYALPCFSLSKRFKKSPHDTAEEIESQFSLENVTTQVNGPYVNFFIDKAALASSTIPKAIKKTYGKGNEKKTVVVDYSGPNVAKHMGVHNIRSTVIGKAVYNLHKYAGHKTIGTNYLGDWGTNFGQLIVAVQRWSSETKVKEGGVKELNRVYVKFHKELEKIPSLEAESRAVFQQLEAGNKDANKFWKLFREVSLEDYEKIYKRMDITFDEIRGEAAAVPDAESTLKTFKRFTKKDQGALVIPFKTMPPCLLIKSDGASTYGLRDLSTALYRMKKFSPDKVLYVVDVAQKLHFKQVFAVLKKLHKKNKDVFEHVVFGRLRFKDKNMSTRKGNIILLEEVLEKAVEKVQDIIKEKNPKLKNKKQVAEEVGIGAVIFHDLFSDRSKDIVFEWDQVLSLEGDSGPYVQYAHARCCALLKKYKKEVQTKISFSLLTNKEEFGVVKLISSFPEVLQKATETNRPSLLAKYLVDLASAFNTLYGHHTILDEDEDIAKARILLVLATKNVLSIGLSLLNMKSPEAM